MAKIGCFSPKISHPEHCVQSTAIIQRAGCHCPKVVPHDKFGQDPIWNGRDRLFLAPKSVIRNAMFSQPEPYQGQLVTITLWSPMPSLVKIRSEMTDIGCFSLEISHPEHCVQSTGTILRAVGRCPIVVTHGKFGQDPIWNGRHMLRIRFFAIFCRF